MHAEATRSCARPADLLLALVLALAGALFARWLFQERMLGDGAGLATFYARGDRVAYHFLFLPACRLVAPLAFWSSDPIEPTRLVSALAYGAGAAFAFLLARDLGAARASALAAALLLASTPAALFFGTTVEVHALHLATVGGAAWLVLRLPWRRPALALPGAAALLALAFWAHQLAVLLLPGWLAWCAFAARRAGRALSPRFVLGVAAPAFFAGLLAASALANRLRHGSFVPSADHELSILSQFARPEGAWRFAWDGWLRPLAFLLPAALAGFARGGFEPGARRALALLIGLPTLFLFAWGVSEYGGYTLGHAAFLAVLAARALPRTKVLLAALPLVLLLGSLALNDVRQHGRGFAVADRVELVRRHLAGGTFLATVDNAPSLTIYLPGATEVSAGDVLTHAAAEGLAPEATVSALLANARAELERGGRLLVDLGFETQRERAPIQARLPVLEPLVTALCAEFPTTRVDDPCWPLLIVEPESVRH
jgi:hypothetical protein